MPLESLGCQVDGGRCEILGNTARKNDQGCACCVTFAFEEQPGGDARAITLVRVFVYHSAARYDDVRKASLSIAKTMGLPDGEGPVVDSRAKRQTRIVEWRERATKQRAVLNIEVSRLKVWTTHLALSLYPEE